MEEEIIIRHAELIYKAGAIIQKRIDLLTPVIEIGNDEEAARLYQVRSLDIFKRFLTYISNELKKNDAESAFFLIPHVRTLMDIYSKFLHLQINAQDDKTRALISIGNQLLAAKNAELVKEFNDIKSVYCHIINGSILEAVEYENYSFNWMQKNNLNFYKRDLLLTEANVNRFAINTGELFKGQHLHKLYSAFSELNHGNPFYGSNQPHNERFWVISMTIQFTAYLIELIDRDVLRQYNQADLRLWLKEIQENSQLLRSAWKEIPLE